MKQPTKIDLHNVRIMVLLGVAFGTTSMSTATGQGPQPFMFLLSCLIAGALINMLREPK